MTAIKIAVGLTAAVLLVLKLTDGVGTFASGGRIDATAVTLLVVIAVTPLLDRITKIGTEGIEVQPATELDDVKQRLDRATSGHAEVGAAAADAQAAAHDPMAVVVEARTRLADTLRSQVRHHAGGLVGPSIADNARRLGDHDLITAQLAEALQDLGRRLDTARRPSPQYAADIADLAHTAIGSVNQQIQDHRSTSGPPDPDDS